MSFFGYTIKELEVLIHKKELSAEDIVDMSFNRIKEVDEEVQAFITLNEDEASAHAKMLDASTEDKQKLFSLPVGIKDNIMTKGLRTTAASQILANFDQPLYNATVIDKLNSAQAITIGKLNMDEFAMGSTTQKSSYGITRNPWNLDYVPGGSSGGSAAAVAAGEVLFALGSDTGGSVRQPASFTGIVGMKPTYGRVSRNGLIALASSLEQIGPMTHTVEDNARVLEVISGYDANDSTSANKDVPAFSEGIKAGVRGLKIAVPEEYLGNGVTEEVRESVMNALKMFELLGATVDNISLPHSVYAPAAYYVLSAAEASASLARYDGVRFGVRAENAENMIDMMELSRGQGFGDEVKKRILFGTYVLGANQYASVFEKAQKIRTLVKKEFTTIFETYDIVIGPTTASTAFKVGEENVDSKFQTMNDLLNVPANLAGLPAISIPAGFSENGLPLGLQMIGQPFAEQTLYRAAYAYEDATNHHKKRPVLGGASK